jgi:hypothetical protein
MVLAWHLLRGAILQVPLSTIGRVMSRFLEHLGRCADRHRLRRIDAFLNMIRPKPG